MSTLTANKYPDWLQDIDKKIVQSARYRHEKAIQDIEERRNWANSPSYFKPMTGNMPRAEKIKCCALQGSMFHFIKCFDLEN